MLKQFFRWRYLIGYNIFVITAKAVLQIPGCIFIQKMNEVCWIVQLFGISCIRKFNLHATSYTVSSHFRKKKRTEET